MCQTFLVQNNWNSLNFVKLIIMKKYLYFLLFTPFIFYGQIQINEIFADNGDCCLDEVDETEDYLELINIGPSPIDLAGYYFGDQDGGSVIPSGSPEITTISSGGLLLLWFDQDLEQGPLHVDAKLNNDGETILGINNEGDTIFNITYGPQSEDITFAAVPDGEPYNNNWVFTMCPTPGNLNESCPLEEGCTGPFATNYNETATVEDGSCIFSELEGLMITEYSAANCNEDGNYCGDYEDWFELYNNTGSVIDLSGYYLSDKIDNLTKWQFPSSLIINPNTYVIIYASGLDPALEESNNNTSFKLTQTRGNEYIILSDSNGVVQDYVQVTPHQLNHSVGRTTEMEWEFYTNPTPGEENDPVSFVNYVSIPVFNTTPGFYEETVSLSIACDHPEVDIYYTLDGGWPDENDNYYGSTDTDSNLSVETEFLEISSTTVVRAIAISQNSNFLNSFSETNTYFINESHGVMVISIAGDDVDNLLYGNGWMRPLGSFEIFDTSGVLMDEAAGEFNEHGNDSWAYDQRGIDYITRDQYGYNYGINDKLFTTKDRDSFQRLILKAAANDNYPATWGSPAHIRDSYVHSLSQIGDLRMDERSHESCILYVNGEYWGVYDVREKVDDLDFLDYYYDQGEGYVDFLKTWGNTWIEFGDNTTDDDWDDLVDFITGNDMSDADNYTYVKSVYNTGSLIDYFILNSYVVCMDWLNWNTGWWRGTHPEGDKKKWRYILWDMDATFGHYVNYTGIPDTGASADPCDPEGLGDPGGQGHVPILNALFDNDEFTADYVNRYADLSNTIFSCDFMISHLDSLITIIEPEMPRQIERWGGSFSTWEENVQELKDYILERCSDEFVEGMEDCYDVEAVDVTIIIEGDGEVQVNTIDLVPAQSPWTGIYYAGLPIELSANSPDNGITNFYWEVLDGDLILLDPTDPNLIFDLTSAVTIVAHFDACVSIQTEEIVGPTIVESGSIWQYTFPSEFTNTSEWSVVGGEILFTSANENTIAIQWNYGVGQGQIILNQYNNENVLECLFVNITIEEIPQTNVSEFNNTGLLIFPNPTESLLNVVTVSEVAKNISLYDLSGHLILSFNTSSLLPGEIFSFNISEVSTGIYLLAVQTESNKIFEKIIIE